MKQINQLTAASTLSGSDIFELEQFFGGQWNSAKVTLSAISTFVSASLSASGTPNQLVKVSSLGSSYVDSVINDDGTNLIAQTTNILFDYSQINFSENSGRSQLFLDTTTANLFGIVDTNINSGSLGTQDGTIYIGNQTPSIPGDYKTTNIHIGNSTAGTLTTIHNSLKYIDGNQAANKVLTSSANGTATWQTLGVSSISIPTARIPFGNASGFLTSSANFTYGETASISTFSIVSASGNSFFYAQALNGDVTLNLLGANSVDGGQIRYLDSDQHFHFSNNLSSGFYIDGSTGVVNYDGNVSASFVNESMVTKRWVEAKGYTTNTGTVTSVSVATNQGVSGSVANATTTPVITLSLGALTGVTSLNGLVVAANTGVITTGTWSASTILANRGGTGYGSYAVGDILYADTTSTLAKLTAGAAGAFLRFAGAGVAPTVSTLILPNSATANRLVYATGTNTWGDSSNFIVDNTNVRLGIGATPLSLLHLKCSSLDSAPAIWIDNTASSLGSWYLHTDNSLGPTLTTHTDSSGNSTLNNAASRWQAGSLGHIFSISPATSVGAARTFTEAVRISSPSGSDVLTVTGNGNGSMRSGIRVNASDAAGQATNYMFNDRNATSSYGGQIYGGTTNSVGNLFGVSRADKYFIFADGASNLGMAIGTLSAQPLIIGTNNAEAMRVDSSGNLNFAEGKNIILGTTTGTKIGTATSQKIGFFNATPVIQPTTAISAATYAAVGGLPISANDTFGGYTIGQIVSILKTLGLTA